MTTKLTKYFLVFILMIGMIGCGDDSGTGPDAGETPGFPELEENNQPDVSFFENNTPAKAIIDGLQATDNFYTARGQVLGAAFYFAFGQVYGSFFSGADQQNAEFNNGQWEWNYSSTYEGVTVEYRITAEDLGSEMHWEMFWSYDDGQQSLVNYKLVEGTVAKDGSQGTWTFNSLNPDTNQEEPAIESSWSVTSETVRDITTKVYDSDGLQVTVDYEEDAPEYRMTFTYTDGSDNVEVYWNTDTSEGYVIQGTTQYCWDSSFQDVACS